MVTRIVDGRRQEPSAEDLHAGAGAPHTTTVDTKLDPSPSSRTEALQQVREDWWQMRQAGLARRHQSLLCHLQRVQRAQHVHGLTLHELMVASGVFK